MRWAEHVAQMGEKRNAYRILVEKLEETTKKTKRWVDNIKIDLRDRMGWYGLDRSGSG
jgi:hypothetical protein